MARTHRNIRYALIHRCPRHKHKLLAGEPRKQVTTWYDDKPVAAMSEVWDSPTHWHRGTIDSRLQD